jgi:hypothetical protein
MTKIFKKTPKFNNEDDWIWRFCLVGKNFDEKYAIGFLMSKTFFTKAEHASVKAEMTKYAEMVIDEFLEDYYE